MSTGRSTVSVVLLPDERDMELLIKFSAMLNEHIDSKIQLSAACLPHITLVQFFAAETCLDNVWRDVKTLNTSVTDLPSTGLGFVPDGKGSLWVELGFTKGNDFMALQTAVATSKTIQRFEIHNPIGDRARPHITLALTDISTALPTIQLGQWALFKRPFSRLRLAVGVNGERWILTQVCHSA